MRGTPGAKPSILLLVAALTLAACAEQPNVGRPITVVVPPETSARWAREGRLIDLAAQNDPDFRREVRRVAEQNVASGWGTSVEQQEFSLHAQVRETLRERDEAPRRAMAEQACSARARMATAMYPDRSILGLNAAIAGQDVFRACADYYRATGQVPGF